MELLCVITKNNLGTENLFEHGYINTCTYIIYVDYSPGMNGFL